jgi:hypothetical protein
VDEMSTSAICGTMPIIEIEGQRVITLPMIDIEHQRPDGTARRNFNANKDRLLEGKHYFVRNSSEARGMGLIAPNGAIFLNERGYLLLVKSFTDDLAWEVQERLVEGYFRAGVAAARQLSPAELLHAQSGLLVEMERRQLEHEARTARQAEQLEVVQSRVEEVASASALPQRPANSEAISHIKARIYKEYGVPAHVVEFVLRQSPYQLKPAAMVKHNVEEAQGGTYAVFWTKDVNAVFRRFVGECQRVTAAFVTHPYVADRFKLKPGIEGAAQ